MGKKILVIVVMVVLLVVAGIAIFFAAGNTTTIEVTRDKIQSVLDDVFPVSLSDENEETRVEATLSDPNLLLDGESDRIGLEATVVARPLPLDRKRLVNGAIRQRILDRQGGEINGRVGLTGELRFDPDQSTFYLSSPKIEKLEINREEGLLRDRLIRIVERGLGRALADRPVYTIDDSATVNRAAKQVIKSVNIRDGKVNIEIGI